MRLSGCQCLEILQRVHVQPYRDLSLELRVRISFRLGEVVAVSHRAHLRFRVADEQSPIIVNREGSAAQDDVDASDNERHLPFRELTHALHQGAAVKRDGRDIRGLKQIVGQRHRRLHTGSITWVVPLVW